MPLNKLPRDCSSARSPHVACQESASADCRPNLAQLGLRGVENWGVVGQGSSLAHGPKIMTEPVPHFPDSALQNNTHDRSNTSTSCIDGITLSKPFKAFTLASMRTVATCDDSSTASTTTWFKMTVDSARKTLPCAAHCATKSRKCVCNALVSSSDSTRLAVYIQTLDTSGSVNFEGLLNGGGGEIRHGAKFATTSKNQPRGGSSGASAEPKRSRTMGWPAP